MAMSWLGDITLMVQREVDQEGEGVQLPQELCKVPLGATQKANIPVTDGSEDEQCETVA